VCGTPGAILPASDAPATVDGGVLEVVVFGAVLVLVVADGVVEVDVAEGGVFTAATATG